MSDAGEVKRCPVCGGELREIEDLPDEVAKAVPFPFDRTVESIWEGARLRVRVFECGKCGLLLVFRRRGKK